MKKKESDSIKFSERIKKYRNDNNLTQTDLANILFVSKQAVSKWENDRSMPDVSLYSKLSELLGISIDEMLGNEKKHKNKIIVFISVFISLIFAIAIIISSFKLIEKNKLINEIETNLNVKVPKIEEYDIIKYNDWLVYNNSFYPAEIYYLVFSKEMIVVDDTWLTTLSKDIIDVIPISSGEYPYICDYYKLIDITNNKYNEVTLESEKHEYILYCLQIQNKRLIAIKFEV